MPTQSLLEHAISVVGGGAAWAGTDADGVDGICPRVVARPAHVDDLSSLLEWASSEGLTVSIRGGGTKLEWGGIPDSIDLAVSTSALSSVIAHRDGDLTATIEAGATLSRVNGILGEHRQWLPLDPPWSARATIGGVVATNDSGPSRHRHGAPRDLIIGVTVVRPDGELAKAGGIVVKNVAGYDLSRLMTGAFGSLGVVVDATFKLAPVAAASRTVMLQLGSIEAMAPVAMELLSSALTPVALELEWPPARLLVRFQSVESAVEEQAREVGRLATAGASSCAVTTCDGAEEAALWTGYEGRWDEPGTLLKLSTVVDQVFPTLIWLRDESPQHDVQMSAQGRAGLGVVDVRLDGPVEAQARIIGALRERFPSGRGSAVIRRGVPELRRAIDPWGPIGDGLPVMRAIKRRFDPRGLMNPQRGPAMP